jgi:uncharacterized membrane protein YccC
MDAQTCPKCGKQFYGAGCPDCDFPASPPDMGKIRRQQFMAFALLAALLTVLVRLFIQNPSFRLPIVVGVFGLVLFGWMLASDARGRAYALAVGLIYAGLSPVLFYCAFSEVAHWSAPTLFGISFVPWWWNDTTTRWLMGFFGCLCAACSLWCFYQVIRPRKRP